ncbi:MAG: hypothetical protein JNL75_07725 [Chitinophagales bacterium]|nr:hypothetical protein [Chitinophagales bacterium]
MDFIKKLFNKTQQFEFVQDNKGLHQIGGEIPSGFKIPNNQFLGGFQYLGIINNADRQFEWLPFPLHLICPIFTDFDYIFLDYEKSNEPELIYPTNSAAVTSAYDELTKESYVVYNRANFSLKPFNGINDENEFEVIAITGKPHWTQSSDVPTCPKSKKKMRFICQLMSNAPITAKEKNFKSDDDYYENIFKNLNFWCDGNLKVFFEPTSKVACYFIQNT